MKKLLKKYQTNPHLFDLLLMIGLGVVLICLFVNFLNTKSCFDTQIKEVVFCNAGDGGEYCVYEVTDGLAWEKQGLEEGTTINVCYREKGTN